MLLLKDTGPVLKIGGKRCQAVLIKTGEGPWRIVPPAYIEGDEATGGFRVLTARERIQRALSGGTLQELFQQLEVAEGAAPHKQFVLEREVEIDSRIDRLAIPEITRRLRLCMAWTSKSHALRTVGTGSIVRAVKHLCPGPIRRDRVFRELRSLLKNGLPAVYPATERGGRFGDILTELNVAVVRWRTAKTDTFLLSPSGQEKAQFIRHFDILLDRPDETPEMLRDAELLELERYERDVPQGRITVKQFRVRGAFLVRAPLKLVSTYGTKGMAVPIREQLHDPEGRPIDVLIDYQSFESKDALFLLPKVADNVWFVGPMLFGATDHGLPLTTREKMVSVRPEVHVIGGLRTGVMEALREKIRDAEELRRMAEELGLVYI